jgi:two-component system KDP operon response regulator KdpE
LKYPGVEIDLERRRVLVSGEEVRLSRTEWELLSQLAGNVGKVMLHAELLTRIWGPEFRDEAHYLRTWVSRLRAKLEADPSTPQLITTFPGLGYRLEAPPAE